MKIVEIELPIKVVSEANRRDHWTVKRKRASNQKIYILTTCKKQIKPLPTDATAIITLTRIGKMKLDTDNLAISFKAVRDAISYLLRIDDGDDRLTWLYAQEKARKKDKNPSLLPNGTGIRIKVEMVQE